MASFKSFSLADAVGAGQKLASNQFAMEGAVAERKTQGKAAVLRQKMVEGDPDAFAELAGIDIDQATKTMDAVKTMGDNEREQFKAQNDAVAKAGMWIMQGQSPEDQEMRFNQSVDHFKKQGMDMSDYEGQFSPQLIQNSIMQSRTIAQMITSQTQKGVNKGLDAQGNPVFFSTDPSGEASIMKDVKPSGFQVHGKGGKGGKGDRFKAADSNAISKAGAEMLGADWTDSGDIKWDTDEQRQKHSLFVAEAEKIFSANPRIGHRTAFRQAAEKAGITKKAEPKQKGKSIEDYLTDQLKNDG